MDVISFKDDSDETPPVRCFLFRKLSKSKHMKAKKVKKSKGIHKHVSPIPYNICLGRRITATKGSPRISDPVTKFDNPLQNQREEMEEAWTRILHEERIHPSHMNSPYHPKNSRT